MCAGRAWGTGGRHGEVMGGFGEKGRVLAWARAAIYGVVWEGGGRLIATLQQSKRPRAVLPHAGSERWSSSRTPRRR